VVGFDFLRPKGHAAAIATPGGDAKPILEAQLELVLVSEKLGYKAKAVEIDGEFTVIAGSTATTKDDFAVNGYALLRGQLINENRLVASPDPGLLEFMENVTFPSASAAAAVITNRNTNGRTAWRLASSGQTLKDWQDAQIATPTP
jgi:hypothetical protein